MRLKYMEYILEIARSGSFSKAAKQLFISQQSLSELVMQEEEKLGFPIFVRSNRGVQLTETGELFVKDIENILKISRKWDRYAFLYHDDNPFQIFMPYYLSSLVSEKPFVDWIVEGRAQCYFEKLADAFHHFQSDEKAVFIALLRPQHSVYEEMMALAEQDGYVVELSEAVPMLVVTHPSIPKNSDGTYSRDTIRKMDYVRLDRSNMSSKQYSELEDELVYRFPPTVDLIQFIASREGCYGMYPRFVVDKHILYKSGRLSAGLFDIGNEYFPLYIAYHASQKERLKEMVKQIRDCLLSEHAES